MIIKRIIAFIRTKKELARQRRVAKLMREQMFSSYDYYMFGKDE